jgi:serine/threonine protein phosphatase 1
MPSHIIAIGDIHGDSIALARLIAEINPTEGDTLVILGDVIDCGPDSCGVIELLLDLERRCQLILLMGNHEEMLFATLEGRDDRRFWFRFGGRETLDSYGITSGDPNAIPPRAPRFLEASAALLRVRDPLLRARLL